MKSIQELYNEVMASEELKAKCIEAAQAGKVEAFLKEHGCEATMEEVSAFLKARTEEDAPLSLDELDSAAGGTCNNKTAFEGFISGVSLGLACAVQAICSTAEKGQHSGQQNPDEGRLCSSADYPV